MFAETNVRFSSFTSLCRRQGLGRDTDERNDQFTTDAYNVAFRTQVNVGSFRFGRIQQDGKSQLAVPRDCSALYLVRRPFDIITGYFYVDERLLRDFIIRRIPRLAIIMRMDRIRVSGVDTFDKVDEFRNFFCTDANRRAARFGTDGYLTFAQFCRFAHFGHMEFTIWRSFGADAGVITVMHYRGTL